MTAPKKAATPARKPHSVKCSWCGETFETTHPHKEFCNDTHKQAFANWCASRGKVLFPIAMAWRTQRGRKGTGATAMAEMVRFLDACAAELSAQGAPPIAKHYASTRQYITPWFDAPGRRPSRSKPMSHPAQP